MPLNKKRYIVNFPAHLADCEFNFRRLQRLMPEWCLDTPSSTQEAVKSGIPVQSPTAIVDKAHDKALLTEWRYIIGRKRQNEFAILLKVIDSAKYTTTIRLELHPFRPRHGTWQQYFDTLETHPRAYFSMADQSGKVTMPPTTHLGSSSLEVRLYHDASVAEVIACEGQRHFKARHEYPNKKMYQTDEKAQLNRFLGELLERCLTQGRVVNEIALGLDRFQQANPQ